MGSTTNGDECIDLNYFICTLGQADTVNRNSPNSFKTINDFVDRQAESVPDLPAVAFPIPQDGNLKWSSELFTFEELKRLSSVTAKYLEETVLRRPLDCSARCVALLCPSSIDFLFAWLALMRMGYGVLLIAPQCQPEAISHLCNSCEVSFLLYDKSYSSLAADSSSASKRSNKNLVTAQLPWQDSLAGFSSIANNSSCKITYTPFRTLSENDTAYIHHTSGTSTGLPKPIPQTHRAGVGVLPSLNGTHSATFTTTPLYHGGIADCFRAWTSHALIWLFPASKPITTSTILHSLTSASEASERGAPPVRYFSSVPYVLQMLSEDAAGVEMLRGMELVGVGGAALPSSVGDRLVSRGVRLVTRFGSAECGFLLSSHRDYARDLAWQYLRPPMQSPHLRFEPQLSSGLCELVVLAGWPHVASTNRGDGGFATADLFEPHGSVYGAWMYHSRKDALLTLVTGKKFDPQPLEDAITASSRLIGECLVFGNRRTVPGALIFRAEGVDVVESEVVDGIWGEIETINAKGQSHTRIERAMIVVLPTGAKLSKSSKGTVMRGKAEKDFAKEIEGAYSGGDEVSNSVVDDIDVLPTIRNIVGSVCGGKALGGNDDFYHCGIDSAKCTQIRALIQKKMATEAYPLPFNVVYDCGTISRLANYIVTIRHDGSIPEENGHQEMLDLVTQFSKPVPLPKVDEVQELVSKPSRHTVLLTGATGALGAHILDLLNQSSEIKQVFCLVRASSHQNALSRVNESLSLRRKSTIGPSATKISCLPSNLGEANLGLSQIVFTRLIKTVTLIIHAAWPVNFSLPLRTFTPQFNGLQTLLSLTTSPLSPHLLFCSSTASVLAGVSPIIETISHSPSDADSLGYSRSKWVAEQICHRFPGQSASICRIGQLTGDTKNGAWNMSEAYPRMLSTLDPLGCLPNLQSETLTWLPLDIAAKCVFEVALAHSGGVYHVVNNNCLTTWTDLLEWIAEMEVFEVVEPGIWLERLEGLAGHPASGLVGLWNKAYRGDGIRDGNARELLVFDTERTDEVAMSAREIKAIDKEFFQKVWRWLRGELGSMS